MTKHSFIIPLLLLASQCSFSCYDPACSGRCGPNGIGPRNPSAYFGGTVYTPPHPRIVMLPDRVGAIAVNQTTFASTYNMSSKKEARQKALRDCQYGQKQPCRIFTEYRNSCVSLAQGRDKRSGYLVAGFADNRGQASRDAIDKCSAQYNGCSIIIEEECSIAEPPR